MQRIFVTGGAGFIGAHLCARLAAEGHEVRALDNFKFCYDARLPSNFAEDIAFRMDVLLAGSSLVQCCLSEKRRLGLAIAEFAPQCIVHLAAVPLVAYATRHEEYAARVMAEGLLNLLEIVREMPSVERLVFVSSSMVYGDFTRDPMPEDVDLDPVNTYGGLKLAGEVLAKSYLRRTPTEVAIVRPSCVYGPADVHSRVVRKFCEAALAGEPILLNAVNDHIMDFTHVDDLTQGLALAALHPGAAGETFNITYGQGRHLSELVDILARYAPEIHRNDDPIEDGDRPRRGSLSIEKARAKLGYAPRIDLATGIASYLEWLQPGSTRLAAVQAQ